MPSTRPLAIGLLYWAGDPTPVERRRRVAHLTRHVHGEGLALLETFESDGTQDQDDAVRVAVLDLAARVEVRALVVAGPPAWELVRRVIGRSGLTLHFIAEETPMRRVRDRQGWVRLMPQQARR